MILSKTHPAQFFAGPGRPAEARTDNQHDPLAEAFSSAAGEIAEELCRHAVFAHDGSVTWSVVRQEEAGGLRRVPVGPHLGSGALGAAVFLAGLDRVQGRSDHREICLGSVARLRRDIARLDGDIRQAPGGMCGLGSVIYGLLSLSRLLGEPGLALEAARVCRFLDPVRLRQETRLDVMFGLSGLLLCLLALDREPSAGEGPIELAAVCAQRLAAASPEAASPGFSHGAAGIACALARFAHRTGDRPARDAADAALDAAERGLAGAQRRSWCNGTAGLQIARLEALHETSAELHRLEYAPGPYDHLCCGDAGRADVLACAAQRLGDPSLLAAARRLGTALLGRKNALRFPHPEILVEPRLLRGPAGVGYAFLRLADPGLVPCLLTFE